ncbi:MAG TPA: HD domain-containing phosphohydrolase [Solirubrobacteraceae bacterium]|nr:HD domain-containing phosphohydrolase [Solirubrobacteraceae bacterium]
MSSLLLVDDEDALRRWERRVLEAQQYACVEAADVPQARAALVQRRFDLVLLDVNLPGESGMQLLVEVRAEHPGTAVLMVTGEDDLALAARAIELGAYGYLVKPVRAGELLINVTNALHRLRRETELLRRLDDLQSSRQQAEQELRRALAPNGHGADPIALLESESVNRLVRLAEFRDSQTGQHLVRMSRYCELIGRSLGLDDDYCRQLRLASELHDVGKVAIPDRILLKPGTLTSAERRVMETHTEIGHSILSDSGSEVMRMAASIALTHHERWDGGGYPRGLARAEIPQEGRIAAVADVFDALTSDRVYRPAFPVGMAIDMMEAERGRHFEERVLQALHDVFDEVERVRMQFGD